MIDTRLPPADFLRLVADRVEHGQDCRGYGAGLRRAADIVEQHSYEWHALPVPILRELENLLEKRRRGRDRVAS
jgi:hypothetical protein